MTTGEKNFMNSNKVQGYQEVWVVIGIKEFTRVLMFFQENPVTEMIYRLTAVRIVAIRSSAGPVLERYL
jgi:hypothetical protein